MNANPQLQDNLKIIQISDCHLFASDSTLLMGHNTNTNFYDVIFRIKNTQLKNTDLIFLTGDLSQDKTTKSYEHIISKLQDVEIPIYWIPGNHDDKNNLLKVLSTCALFKNTGSLELKHWIFIFLNTQKPGEDSGFIDQNEMLFLKNELKNQVDKNKKIAIIMHHHPMSFGTPLIDNYPLENQDEFWQVINQYNVSKILCGHVHGDYHRINNNTHVESAPATCFQFKKGASSLEIENNIGYKIHYFSYNAAESNTELWMEPAHDK